ncbi:ATP-binding cassette domain-containing protein [Deinococcus multiflagellatus]|uniref:ATP-binding cassette domain-containing protein n=1 Tax=Deinococcus multiflagellatus TaxID=1656887 RepID=A0ABW1ZER5_9DEIO|nr:ATP-binding cassette domain-containing protein [Deinococcus multiflagellatus]MBZ9712737.1 ATP-binding cassette domain-containing protein [Deinococcus multiflagellatus]
MPPLVRLLNVTALQGGQPVLRGVGLEVAPGEALRLWGPNGGGKTTLLRLLAGQVAPVAGERTYHLGGQDQRSAVQARRTLRVVGPDAEAFYLSRDWVQSAGDVLLAAFEGEALNLWTPSPAARARLQEVAALTRLELLLARDFRTLSHGQRRRVLLAAALMPAPELLLLDEFTDGLSERARAELGTVLARVHAAGVAVVLATHRPEEAPPLPWRTLRVWGGQVTEAAPPEEPVARPTPLPRPGDHASAPLVRLQDVTVYRNGERALGPLSWTWAAGQHWLVTGENGSGKSTLTRLIAGELHPAVGGHIERPFLNRDRLEDRRAATGLVGAEVGIRQRRDWTGREVIGSAWSGSEGFAPELTPAQAAEVEHLAAGLGARELLDHPAEGLSQGQWRRLLLARAVIHRPRLLLLDEGLDFLDAPARAAFLALLPRLVQGGTHLLVVAHRAADALPGLTHHLHLQAGQAAFAGPLASDWAHLQALP